MSLSKAGRKPMPLSGTPAPSAFRPRPRKAITWRMPAYTDMVAWAESGEYHLLTIKRVGDIFEARWIDKRMRNGFGKTRFCASVEEAKEWLNQCLHGVPISQPKQRAWHAEGEVT